MLLSDYLSAGRKISSITAPNVIVPLRRGSLCDANICSRRRLRNKIKRLELVSVVHLENEDVLFYSRGKEEEEEEEERIDKVSPGKKHRFARINGIEQQQKQRVDDDDTAEEARG